MPSTSEEVSKKNESAIKNKDSLIGWYILVALIVFSAVSFVYLNIWLGFVFLGIAMIYLGTCLHEIKAPNVGMLFRMGKFVRMIKPGWYLVIPHFWNITQVSTSWQQVDLKADTYTKDKTPIKIKARIFYRAENFDKILLFMPEEMRQRAYILGLAALRSVVGKAVFVELLTDKGSLEKNAMKELHKEFSKYGYKVRDFEIYDFDETTESAARRILVLGEARGEAAEKLARAVKDNTAAAILSGVGIAAESVERIAGNIWGSKEKTSEGISSESHPSTTLSSSEATLMKRLGEAINKFLGRI